MRLLFTVILRIAVGMVVGAVVGAAFCAIVLVVLDSGSHSFGGIGSIENPRTFAAFLGAIAGACYGAPIGGIAAGANLGPVWGALAGLAISGVIAWYLVFRANNPSSDSMLSWIVFTGGTLGSITGSVSRMLIKQISWLAV